MPFVQLNISILPENVTRGFSDCFALKFTCEHIYYIPNHAQPSLFCETENLVDFVFKLLVDLVMIARFTYVSKNNYLLYLM